MTVKNAESERQTKQKPGHAIGEGSNLDVLKMHQGLAVCEPSSRVTRIEFVTQPAERTLDGDHIIQACETGGQITEWISKGKHKIKNREESMLQEPDRRR